MVEQARFCGKPEEIVPRVHSQTNASYDDVTYRSGSFAVTRLDNLAVVGILAGLNPAEPRRCRVLEIGCAGGGNSIPLAAMFPKSEFLGIDRSTSQVDQAIQLIAKSGLTNIEVRLEDIMSFELPGRFDFIIAHGIYSWVPPAVRDRVMEIFRLGLTPNGIGYLCFNALPGFYLKRITREMMQYHGRDADSVHQLAKKARTVLTIASTALPAHNTPYMSSLRSISSELLSNEDWFLLHDDLEEFCEGFYLNDVVSHARRHGLSYLGGAQPQSNLLEILPPDLVNQIRPFGTSVVELEQYCDFLVGTRYRDAIFSPTEVALDRSARLAALRKLYFAARLTEVRVESVSAGPDVVRFVNEGLKSGINLAEPRLIGMLRFVVSRWPHCVGFEELYEVARRVLPNQELAPDFVLHNLYALYCHNMLELWPRRTDFIASNIQMPLVSKTSRVQIEMGRPLSNLRHEDVYPIDQFTKVMLPNMDGSRDIDALEVLLAENVSRGTVQVYPAVQGEVTRLELRNFLERGLTNLWLRSLLSAH